MKLLALLLSSFLTLTVSAQQGSLPAKPGSTTAAAVSAQLAESPTLPEPEAPGSMPAPQSVDSSTTTISGAAVPSAGSLAIASSPSPPSEKQGSDSAPPAAPDAPKALPSDLPGKEAADESQKVDFLQRSNLILAKLLESDRVVDPFGLVMDPGNAKEAPLLADQYEEEKETTVINNSMLRNALLTLPITGVYPQQEKIVIGARSFGIGGQFGMKLQDLTIRLRFEGIRGGEIFFKDMETSEVTSLPYNVRPAEFEPIVKGSKRAPGQGIVPMNGLYIAN
jgi:hypothetical protein